MAAVRKAQPVVNEEVENEKDNSIKDWMSMINKQKENIQPYIPSLQQVLSNVNAFIGKIFTKKFKSDDLDCMFSACIFVLFLCTMAFPVTSAIFIWASFPIFKIWATSFIIGSFAASAAAICFIVDEKS